MATMEQLADRAIAELAGTSRCFHDLGPEFEDAHNNSAEFNALIDDAIFCCEQCGWWCEISEQVEDENGEWLCNDCGGQNE